MIKAFHVLHHLILMAKDLARLWHAAEATQSISGIYKTKTQVFLTAKGLSFTCADLMSISCPGLELALWPTVIYCPTLRAPFWLSTQPPTSFHVLVWGPACPAAKWAASCRQWWSQTSPESLSALGFCALLTLHQGDPDLEGISSCSKHSEHLQRCHTALLSMAKKKPSFRAAQLASVLWTAKGDLVLFFNI